jgi:hypothetical protein
MRFAEFTMLRCEESARATRSRRYNDRCYTVARVEHEYENVSCDTISVLEAASLASNARDRDRDFCGS